ncbi:MAG: OsmC family protein, partial [Ktedonobacterales bacterium]
MAEETGQAPHATQHALAARLVYRGDLGANRFDAAAGVAGDEAGWHTLPLDSAHGDDVAAGASPMELLLVTLGGCIGMSVVPILRKIRQVVTAYDIRVTGERSQGWPVVFTAITVEHRVTGRALDRGAIERAITLA